MLQIKLYARNGSVAPVRERGLKYQSKPNGKKAIVCRSRKGAWIEIALVLVLESEVIVAPVRERGLKSSALQANVARENGRSRKGAWIEI